MFASNSTPVWLLMIFSAISVYGAPQIKKLVSRHVDNNQKQNICTFLIMLVVIAVVVTLSVMIWP